MESGKRWKKTLPMVKVHEINDPPPFTSIPKPSTLASQMDQETSDSTYHQRKIKLANSWQDGFENLKNIYFQEQSPLTKVCCVCGSVANDIIVCRDCNPHSHSGHVCYQTIHRHATLHTAVQWNEKEHQFYPYKILEPEWKRVSHECNEMFFKSIVVVSADGFQKRVRVLTCPCESFSETLIRHCVWPATPSDPRIGFQFSVMEMLTFAVIECQVSMKGFFEILKWKNYMKFQEMPYGDLYRIMTGECFEAYRHFRYLTRNMETLIEGYDNNTTCPACPSKEEEDETVIYSLDACFGLCRRKNAGSAARSAYHIGRFFLPQEDVDHFVATYSLPKTEQGDCGDFKAGSNLRSKGRFAGLDETGLFGAACRHEHPKAFFNLKKGEKLANAVHLIRSMKKDTKCHMTILYDIACKLKPHLKIGEYSEELHDISLGIPIFHCFGHRLFCQVNYSPRRMEGIGFTDGETLERLWSFLRRFKPITKEMSPDHRQDLLVDGLIHYAHKLKRKITTALCSKYNKAISDETLYDSELKKLMRQHEEMKSEIPSWIENEKSAAQQKKVQKDGQLPFEEEYAFKLYQYSQLRDQEASLPIDTGATLRQDIARFDKVLQMMERKHSLSRWDIEDLQFQNALRRAVSLHQERILEGLRLLSYEHMCLVNLMKKYADGQAIFVRINKQLKTLNKKILGQCDKYNNLPPVATAMPNSVSPDSVKHSGSVDWFPNDGGQWFRRQAIELFSRRLRAEEEQALIKKELRNIIQFHLGKCAMIQSFLETHNITAGETAVLLREKQLLITVACSVVDQASAITYVDDLKATCLDLSTFPSHTFPSSVPQPAESDSDDSDQQQSSQGPPQQV